MCVCRYQAHCDNLSMYLLSPTITSIYNVSKVRQHNPPSSPGFDLNGCSHSGRGSDVGPVEVLLVFVLSDRRGRKGERECFVSSMVVEDRSRMGLMAVNCPSRADRCYEGQGSIGLNIYIL